MPDLHTAAAHGDLVALRRAIDDGANLNEYDEQGRTALMVAAESNSATVEVLRLLIARGADIDAVQRKPPDPERSRPPSLLTPLIAAIKHGTLDKIEFLLAAGADARYVDPCGYGTMLNAVFRALVSDPTESRQLLQRLAVAGASLDRVSAYNESPLSVASSRGRFDLVSWLVELGANSASLGWNELFFAIAARDLQRVQACVADHSLTAREAWERTPLLLAVQAGDVEIVAFLQERGGDLQARGRCGQTALQYAVRNDDAAMICWLLDHGADLTERNEFGEAPLELAVREGCANALCELLTAGASATALDSSERPLMDCASSPAVIDLLVEHGAELSDLRAESRLGFLRYELRPDAPIGSFTPDLSNVDSREPRQRIFGSKNPERMNSPFRDAMIRSRASAYAADAHFGATDSQNKSPTWCFSRFGQSLTQLPDGRFVEIGGEHEDHYDPDFCIYNDVVVHRPGGEFELFGYPESVFPPTDFHTATLLGDSIYIIGCLSYPQQRRPGFTPVFRLKLATMAIEPVECAGASPGWIYDHRAQAVSAEVIEISGGKIVDGREDHTNERRYRLNVTSGQWSQI